MKRYVRARVAVAAAVIIAGYAMVPGLPAAATATRAASTTDGPTGKKVYPTVAVAEANRTGVHPLATLPLRYGGAVDGIGVTTGPPKVYVVFWGSQWGTATAGADMTFSNDPKGLAPRIQQLMKGIGTNNELWSGVATQYCEGVTLNATTCPATSAHVGYPTGGAYAGVWYDNSAAAPTTSTDHQIAVEAVLAAGHFGNTTAASNRSAQYFIVSSTGTHPGGFSSSAGWCAWHDYNGDATLNGGAASSPYGDVAFTNMPYLTDLGSSCGASYVNSGSTGALDGVSIVGGHEYSETITDQNPAGGWTDSNGDENADKCAWVGTGGTGGAQNVAFANGSFAMQGTWSNDTNGCAISHSIVVNQSVPDAPTIGTATAGDGQAGLTWTAPANNGNNAITGYAVTPYVGASAQPVQTFNSTATSQTITGLTNGTTYTFAVAAINGIGTGAASAASNAVTPAGAPGTPTIGTATAGNASASLAWTAPSANGSAITGYTVTPYVSGVAQAPQVFASTLTSQNLTGLTNGTTYTFTVLATNGVGNSPESAQSNAVTPALPSTVPGAPTIGTAVRGDQLAHLTWTAPSDDGGSPITGYEVTPYLGAVAQPVQDFTSTATSQDVTNLTNGTTYTFTVAAINAVGTGGPSAASNPVTPATTPSAPTITKSLPGNGSAAISWTGAATNGGSTITGYDVESFIGGTANGVVHLGASARSTTYAGLANGTTYTFRVAAVNGVGPHESIDSVPVTVGAPATPGFQSAAPGNATAKVAWTAPANNGSPITGYRITPYVGSSPAPYQTFNTTATSDIVTGLTNGVSYSFHVSAINANGVGAEAATGAVVVGTPTGPGFPHAVPGTTTARISWLAAAPNAAAITSYVVTPYVGTTAQPAQTFNSTATIQTVTGLTSGTTYTFDVVAVNSFGPGQHTTASAIVEGTPGVPGFQSASPGNASAKVQYLTPPANSAPISSYTVWPVQGSTVGSPQVFATPSATQLTVTGLSNGVSYTFRVAATNSVGTGPYALTNAVVVGTPTAPGFPSAQPGDGTAKVAWSAANGNGSAITGYVITPYVGTVAQAPQTFASAATSEIVTGLTDGTTYTFKVAATNALGTGPVAATSLSIKEGTPTSPGFPSAAPLDSSAKVSFVASNANGSPITGYVVTPYIGSVAQPAQTFTSTATSEVVTGLTNGTTYTFRVAAVNGRGTGSYATTGAVKVGLPAAPTGVTATVGVQQATVSWTAAADHGSAITGYTVTPYIGSVAQAPQVFASNATTQLVTGLTTGTSYTFKVTATNAVGTGAASAASNAIVPT